MSYIPLDVRRLVRERADGRCEYCRVPEFDTFMPHEIDHIYAEKHGGATVLDNLCFSCWICNRHKGTDLTSLDPLTGGITPLFHPRFDIWLEHFTLDGPLIQPLSARARVTIQLLQMNKRERVDERRLLISLGYYP
ncbi:MAG: HNH endonuclease [Anaerolineaceae bacterium]|nr:HNH endonuclease [Anaerolineaceae bacterium]